MIHTAKFVTIKNNTDDISVIVANGMYLPNFILHVLITVDMAIAPYTHNI